MKLKLIPQQAKRATINVFLPSILSGVLNQWLTNKTPQEFYNFVKTNTGQDWFSGMLNPRVQSKIKGMADDLKWLNVEWFVGAIVKEHRDIAILIVTSPGVKAELENQIENIKDGLSLDKT